MSLKNSKYYKEQSDKLGWGKESKKIDQERIEILEKYLTGKKVLDIGCGWGDYVNYISKIGYEGWGIDFVKEFINFAKKNNQGRYILGRAEKLPFKDNSFDTVIMFDILEHTDDFKILKEAARVTNKRIIAIVPKMVDFELQESGVIYRHYIDKSHLREYSENMLKELGAKANLKILEIKAVHKLHNETVFSALFKGNKILHKIVRKFVLFLLPQNKFYQEFAIILEK